MEPVFDRDPNLIYLNSANLSLCPGSVLEAVTRYQREFELNPTTGLTQAWDHLWKAQTRLAQFLNANPNDLFLRTNVTATLNTFLLGMPLPPESEILVGELEYGAIVNICRMRAERDHLAWRILAMPQTPTALKSLTPHQLVEHIISQLGAKTKLLLLSHVIAGTGLVLPLSQIAQETRRRGILLAIDGAYAPGALAVDFDDLQDVDFYGCSLYKWMLGPKGTAFGWIAPRHQASIRPLNAGWTTYDIAGPIADFGDQSQFQRSFLMSGCQDFAPYRAIEDTLAFWEENDPSKIRQRMKSLRQHLDLQVTTSLGWSSLSPRDESLQGPMKVYLLPKALQSEGPIFARKLLEKHRIQINMVSLKGQWHIAFSPHIYNSEQEITVAIDRIAAMTR